MYNASLRRSVSILRAGPAGSASGRGANVRVQAKRKRKPKQDAKDSAVASESSKAAPRIMPHSGFSLRKQLRWTRGHKAAQKAAESPARPVSRPAARPSYGKQQMSIEDGIEAARARRNRDELIRKQNEATAAPDLSSVFNSADASTPPAVLIDGYNVLFRHPKLIKLARDRDDLAGARVKLQIWLSELAAARRVHLTVVWDAMGNEARGPVDVTEVHDDMLTIIWAGASEADSIIVRAVQRLKDEGAEYVMVASSDSEVVKMSRNIGAYAVSSQELLKQCSEVRRAGEKGIELSNSQNGAIAASSRVQRAAFTVQTKDLSKAMELQALQTGFECAADMHAAAGQNAAEFYKQRAAAAREQDKIERRIAQERAAAAGQRHARRTSGARAQGGEAQRRPTAKELPTPGFVGTPVQSAEELAQLLAEWPTEPAAQCAEDAEDVEDAL